LLHAEHCRTLCSGHALRMHRSTTSPGPSKAQPARFVLQSKCWQLPRLAAASLACLPDATVPPPSAPARAALDSSAGPDSHVLPLKCEPTSAAARPKAALSLPHPCQSASSRSRWGSQRRPMLAPARLARPCTPCAARPAHAVVSADRLFARQATNQHAVALCAA